MKVNVTKVLRTLAGDELRNPTVRCDKCGYVLEGEPITLRSVCVEALLRPREQQRAALSGEEKLKRYVLAQKVNVEDELDLTAKEIVTLKDTIAEIYPPLVVGQAWQILEGQL